MKVYSILLPAALLLFGACQNENEPEVVPANEGPSDVTEFNLGDSIEFGLPDNMVIDDDSIQIAYVVDQTVTRYIDMEGTGTNDFMIRLRLLVSPGLGVQTWAELLPLHPGAAVHGFQRTDTTFLHHDTTSASSIYRVYSCERLSPWDEVLGTTPNATKVLASESGDVLTINDQFYSEEVPFVQPSGVYGAPLNEPPYSVTLSANRNCFLLPSGQVVYIGVAMLNGSGGGRLGWLKVKSGGVFTIYETALQEG